MTCNANFYNISLSQNLSYLSIMHVLQGEIMEDTVLFYKQADSSQIL